MAIEPKNTREHIISLYGHITGVRKDISQIKNNELLTTVFEMQKQFL